MVYITDPKTKKKKWKSDVDVRGTPDWEAEQDKRRRQMEEDRKRTEAIREPLLPEQAGERGKQIYEKQQTPLPEIFQQPTPQEILQPEITPAQVPIEQAQVPIEEPKELSKGFLKKLVSGEFTDIGKKFEEETGQNVVMGTVPIGGVPVPSTAIITAVSKAKLYTKLAGYGAALFGVRTIANIPEKRISDDLAEMRIIKTSLGRTMLKNIALGGEFTLLVLDKLNEIEAELRRYERDIKKSDNLSYTSRFFGYGKWGETQKYIEDLRESIVPIRELAYRKLGGADVSDELALQAAIIESEIEAEQNE